MRARSINAGLLGLAISNRALSQETPDLTAKWTSHEIRIDPRSMACTSDRIYIRSWYGDVVYLEGNRWQRLPAVEEGRYGEVLAVGPGDEVILQGRGVSHWDGEEWTEIETGDWEGPINAVTMLDSGDVMLVGYGRVGRIEEGKIKSYDAGTWRELKTVVGSSLVDLWTSGQGGTLMHHDGEGWSRMETNTDSWLSGLMLCGEDCIWAWSGQNDYGGSGTTIRHWDGSSWSEYKERIPDFLVGLDGDAERPWAATGGAVYHFDGTTWTVELKTDELGEGWHHFTGICATDDLIAVSEGSRVVWVRER
jgi:hypothetical protein